MSTFDTYRKASPIGFWTIAGAVCIGMLAAHTIELIAAATATRVTLQWAAMEMERSTQRAQSDAQERARQSAARAAQSQQQQLETQQEADAARARAEQERQAAEAKKDAAWKDFYRRDPACDNNPSTETFTRCANEHVRAKTQFEGTYRP